MARRKINVVSLRGAAIPLPQANRAVVDELESLLARAKSGNVVGFCYVTVAPEGHVGTGWAGNAEMHAMVAGAAMLAHRVTAAGTG